MLASLVLLAWQDSPSAPFDRVLAIAGVSRPGRRPAPDDAVVDRIVEGSWIPPHLGDTIAFRGENHTWESANASKDGWALSGSGYLSAIYQAPADQVMLLTATGDSLVYVNGVPRAGDPYSTGNVTLPVQLRKGENEFLFAGGRGRIKATLVPATKPVSLQSADATLPDIVPGDRKPMLGSIIAINATPSVQKGLQIRASWPDGSSASMRIPDITAMTDRKEPFLVPIPRSPILGDFPLTVELRRAGTILDSTTVTVSVRKTGEVFKRTFASQIDGSVQYYAVNPARIPSEKNALVLTLHGAGVEAIGQARAYAEKDDVTIVAPTNRRPYGFDWEDIGRLDGLEVLAIAKKEIPHDPMRVDLVGHSMGGHGTWALGTLYPNLFASMAPSAGWLSFWSYAGGWSPSPGNAAEDLVRRSMNVSDTLGRAENTLAEHVYILHGDADDNVPVTEARTGHAALLKLNHPNLEYHEQPGAGHWWGNQCVDWPPIFDMVRTSALDPDPSSIDFTTQDPAISGNMAWLTLDEQDKDLAPSHIVVDRSKDLLRITVTTTNVARFTLRHLAGGAKVSIDGQPPLEPTASGGFAKTSGNWSPVGPVPPGGKSASRSGPFKLVYNRRFLFVVGTAGDPEENAWAANRARFDAETLMVRGNGSVDIVTDRAYSPSAFAHRNVLLYGNADTNLAWRRLLAKCPVQMRRGGFAGFRSNVGALIVYPNPYDPQGLVGAITGGSASGMRMTDRLGLFTSGVAYPDWAIFSPDAPGKILLTGFFGNDWSNEHGESAGSNGK